MASSADKNMLKPHVDEPMEQLVIAHLGEQYFGFPISKVREVIRHKHITAIPESPHFIAGIADFHGEMALIIDLSIYLSLGTKKNKNAKHIIVIRQNKEFFGLLVDEVSEIIRVHQSAIKFNPDFMKTIKTSYVSGVYAESEERLIIVFNVESIFSNQEMRDFSRLKKDYPSQGENDDLEA